MKYLPFEKFVLTTQLSVDEVQQRLNEKVEHKQNPWLSRAPKTNKPYTGEITSETFRMYRIINYRNSFLPQISGRYIKNYNGTQIQIKMQLHTGVKIFMAIWFGLLGVVCIVILAVMLATIKELFKEGFSPPVLIPFVMFAGGYGLAMIGFKSESRLSKNYLIALLNAKEESEIKAD